MKCSFCGKELKLIETCVFMCKHGDNIILFIAGDYKNNLSIFSIEEWNTHQGKWALKG